MMLLQELKAHAKINLCLRVVGKRKDAYHELESVMHEIELHDTLKISLDPSSALTSCPSLICNEPSVPTDESNLVLKAVKLFEQKSLSFNKEQSKLFKNTLSKGSCSAFKGFLIELKKRIPAAGGLGGGSSDAIAMLHYLAQEVGMDLETQHHLAAALGSDTNFFLVGGTALCKGRGEIVEALTHRFFYFNLVLPPFGCSTPRVFSCWEPNLKQEESLENWLQMWKNKSPVLTVPRNNHSPEPELLTVPRNNHSLTSNNNLIIPRNDLLIPCLKAYPELGSYFSVAKAHNIPLYLSGSGSTLFTLHNGEGEQKEVAKTLSAIYPEAKIIETKSRDNS